MDEQQPSEGTPAGWHDDPQDPTSLCYWDGTKWTDNRAPKPPPAAEAAATSPPWPTRRKVAAGSAAAIIVGSIMPWASMTTAFGTLTVNGTDGDGLITAAGGGLVLFLIFTRRYMLALVGALLTGAGLVYDAMNISQAVGEAESKYATASIGWGLYLAIAGAAVAIVSTFPLTGEKRDGGQPKRRSRGFPFGGYDWRK